jgi:iron complex outermembrane recepter protein
MSDRSVIEWIIRAGDTASRWHFNKRNTTNVGISMRALDHSLFMGACFSVAAALSAGNVYAADAAAPTADEGGATPTSPRGDDKDAVQLSEIVVSASKQGDMSILKTPISVQAVSGADLQQAGALDFNDFAKEIPGLSMYDQGPGNKKYIIRGVNTPGSSTVAATVGVYMDEVPLTTYGGTGNGPVQADPELLDIERVEVLKGPQGTSFGSSSMAGVVRYILNKPDTTNFAAIVRAGAISVDSGGTGYESSATFNAPLIDGKLAARVTLYDDDQPGYVDDRYENNINDYHTKGYRGQLLLNINEQSDLTLLSSRQYSDTGGMVFVNNTDFAGVPVRPRYQSTPERTPGNDSFDLQNATFNYHFGIGTLTATASHLQRDATLVFPASQAVAGGVGVPTSDADVDGVRSIITNFIKQITNSGEIRFASSFHGPLQFLLGAFYSSQNANSSTAILTVNDQGYIDPTVGIRFGGVAERRYTFTGVNEAAIFGQLSYDITDNLKATGGVRAFRFDLASQGNIVIAPFGKTGAGKGLYYEATESSAIGRFNLSYSLPGDDGVSYLEISQGYRPGGVNDQGLAALGGVTVPDKYASDSLINYEVGYKNSFFDHRVRLSSSLFYIDWSNLQLTEETPVTPATPVQYGYTGNAGAARNYGLEFEAQARVISGLDVGVNLGYTDAQITKTTPAGGKKGNDIPYVPRVNASLLADYRFPISTSVGGFVGGDLSWIDSQYTDLPQNVSLYRKLPAYSTVNLRAGTEIGRWTVSLLCKNLFNDDSKLSLYKPTGSIDSYVVTPPRTYMLQVVATL